MARCEPEALFFPSNSPKEISVGLASLLRAFFHRSFLRPAAGRRLCFSLRLAKGNERWPFSSVMPSARSRPEALFFPSGSPKAMSVGLAGLLRAFFFGHASGPQRTGGFVFPLKRVKGNQSRPCQLSACLLWVTPSLSLPGDTKRRRPFSRRPRFFSQKTAKPPAGVLSGGRFYYIYCMYILFQ